MSRYTSAFLLCLHAALICGLIPATQFSGSPHAERITTTLTASSHRHLLEKPQAQSEPDADGFDALSDQPATSIAAVFIWLYDSLLGSPRTEAYTDSLYPDFQERAPPAVNS
ncbi:hypothetical protein [Salinimonas lutimaris]|uniref:hypothetical protein n=1 Tax=Salinimonas lutimaris TaxID=914153 RepID=UPI0010C0AC50|nr:hypothetical protein [Salinimonas lutimaris]